MTEPWNEAVEYRRQTVAVLAWVEGQVRHVRREYPDAVKRIEAEARADALTVEAEAVTDALTALRAEVAGLAVWLPGDGVPIMADGSVSEFTECLNRPAVLAAIDKALER
jgi:hypothetical protein